MKIIDTRGLLCPAPLIMTKRTLRESPDEVNFTVVTDNDISRCNLLTFITEMGYKAHCAEVGAEFHITFSKTGEPLPAAEVCPVTVTANHCVAIASQTMGRGDDDLGEMLMRAFVNSLIEAEQLPATVVLYNSGVLIALKERDTAHSLGNLAAAGVRIVACGACVNFFEVKEQLAPCIEIGNMLQITDILSRAQHVIYP